MRPAEFYLSTIHHTPATTLLQAPANANCTYGRPTVVIPRGP